MFVERCLIFRWSSEVVSKQNASEIYRNGAWNAKNFHLYLFYIIISKFLLVYFLIYMIFYYFNTTKGIQSLLKCTVLLLMSGIYRAVTFGWWILTVHYWTSLPSDVMNSSSIGTVQWSLENHLIFSEIMKKRPTFN